MHVYVTGASGFIGSAVVAELTSAGHRVTGMARSDAAARRLASLGVDVHRAELTDVPGVAAGANAADAVIHLAYRHGDTGADAVGSDRQVIGAIGDALAGSHRPFVVTSGTLGLPTGLVATEADKPRTTGTGSDRGANQDVALSLADRGVRVSVVRLAPCVHDRVKRGFVGGLIDDARRTGVSGYLGDGSQRWPAVHRQDAAVLFRLAVEQAPAAATLHGVGDEGVPLRAIAELIGDRLAQPVREVPPQQADAQFGWLAGLVGTDSPASSSGTRRMLAWTPAYPGLLDDMRTGMFFDESAS